MVWSRGQNDRETDLLSILENIKSGLMTNTRYGSRKPLMMESPHIIISSNSVLKYKLLSVDRWEVYRITNSNKLKKLQPEK